MHVVLVLMVEVEKVVAVAMAVAMAVVAAMVLIVMVTKVTTVMVVHADITIGAVLFSCLVDSGGRAFAFVIIRELHTIGGASRLWHRLRTTQENGRQ
jgi:hypothetical protein